MEYKFDICIDNIVFSLQRVGGISTYFGELIKRLLNSNSNVAFVEQEGVLHNVIRKEFTISANNVLTEKAITPKLIRYLPIKINLTNKSIFHSSYYRICNSTNAVNIITVYDFNYEYGYVRSGIRKYIHCMQKKKAVEKADGVICISKNTKQDLLKIYNKIDPDKIKVVYLAASDEFYPITRTFGCPSKVIHLKSILEKKFILFVGTRKQYKNFNVCIDTISKLNEFYLVIVGAPLTNVETTILEARIPQKYYNLVDISATELNYLYNYAFCLMYPSSYEGFGIPLLEGMQSGCPVLSTKASSIPEVVGDAGLLVDTICAEAFIEQILKLEDTTFRNSIVNAGFEQSKKFSWDKTYKETVEY